MPIVKGQYGKHEDVQQVQFGLGDIRMDKGQYPIEKPVEVHLIITQGPQGKIGREDNENLGKTTDDIPTPDVVLTFDRPESIAALIHTLIEMQKDLFDIKSA